MKQAYLGKDIKVNYRSNMGTVLWSGKLLGEQVLNLDFSNYSLVEVFFFNHSVYGSFIIDIEGDGGTGSYWGDYNINGGGVIPEIMANGSVEYHFCLAGIHKNKKSIKNIGMGFTTPSSTSTNLRNYSNNYRIYKIVGYK